MQLVILASGRGKRMKHLTDDIPKPMLKIKGKPILEHKLNALPKEIDEIIFVIGYKGEHIMNYFKKEFGGRKITYVFQHRLNGTGGALYLVRGLLHDKFLVMMGDDLYSKKDLRKLLKHNLAVMGCEVDDVTQFGILKTDRKGNLTDIIEKPKKCKDRLANIGLYKLSKRFFDYDPIPAKSGEIYLTDILAAMAKDHKIKVEKASLWLPIGHPGDLKKAEEIIHKFA